MCVPGCTQNTPNLRCGFLIHRLAYTPRRHRLADGQLSSLYALSPNFSSFGAAFVMLCCSARPASSSAPLRWSVRYPSVDLVVNIIYIRTIFDHINVLHIFDLTCIVLKSGWSSTRARMPASSLVLLPCLTPRRWPALTTLPPLAKFQFVWRRLCDALLSSSLAGQKQKHPSLLSRLV